ncbi:MAG: hypothetical protein JOZ24_02530 [Candidatus Eremiobacteraeota bacterium]|nr:hypothetical protein [Candidatus Eremiobacteraeota bacterium]
MKDVRSIVHEIRNQLAIAVANVEAFRDGLIEPTPARLAVVAQALRQAEELLDDVPREAASARASLPEPSG